MGVAAGEFAHAVVRAEVGLKARFASQLGVRGAEAAEVVKAGGALKEDRIVADDGVEAGVPGPGGDDHFVTGTDFQGGDGALNRGGAGGDCERELRLHAGGEFFFELQDFGGRVCAVPAEWEFCFQDFA